MQEHQTIILTGASGFIGRHLVRRMAELPVVVASVGIRSLETGNPAGLLVHAANGSPRKLADLRNCTLVHLAWCPPIRGNLASHAHQLELLAVLLDRHGNSFDRVIALGSAEEYGSLGGCLAEHQVAADALSPYGWGKRSAQLLLESWCGLQGKPGLWLRPFTVYGEGQHGQMAIPYAVNQARRGEVAEFSAGTQRRDFIYVDDVARAISLAAMKSWAGFQIANLGTGIGTRLRDVLEQLAVLFNATGSFKFGVRPMRPGEPEVQFADVGKAAGLIGFTSQITLEHGLRRMQKALLNQNGIP